MIGLSPSGSYTTCDASGGFTFYKLPEGQYRVSVDTKTLPPDYVLVSEPAMEADLSRTAVVSGLVFRIEKHVKQLPVRKVSDMSAR